MPKLLFWFVACCLAGAVAQERPPIEIESDTAEHVQAENLTLFEGNVRIISPPYQLAGDKLQVAKAADNNHFNLQGSPVSVQCADCQSYKLSGRLGQMVDYDEAKGYVVADGGIDLCANDNCEQYRVTAQKAELANKAGILTLFGAPQVSAVWFLQQQQELLKIKADKIEFNMAKNLLQLAGNVEVKRGEVVISGAAISVNTQTGEITASERVKAVY